MPKFVVYNGESKHLGRFGWVEKGTPLIMTDKEAQDVRGHRDFSFNRTGAVKKGDDQLGRENEHVRIMLLEIREKSKEQLKLIADELVADGYEIELSENPTQFEILRKIEEALLTHENKAEQEAIAKIERERNERREAAEKEAAEKREAAERERVEKEKAEAEAKAASENPPVDPGAAENPEIAQLNAKNKAQLAEILEVTTGQLADQKLTKAELIQAIIAAKTPKTETT